MNLSEKPAVTLKLLAMKLQMSVSSISKALSNHPSMNEGTRSRVQKMAEQLRYTPNNWAINLRKGRTGIIGIVVPSLMDHFTVKVFCGLEQYASKNGYQLVISQTFDSTEEEIRLAKKFFDIKVDGLFVAVSTNTTCFDHFKDFERNKIPVVYFGKDPLYITDCHKVLVNTFQAGFQATQYLIDNGHSNIAFLNGMTSERRTGDRLNGYISALKENNLFTSGDLNACTDFENKRLDEVIENLFLKPKHLPTALLIGNESVFFEAFGKLNTLNPDLAQHIKCIIFGNTSLSQYLPNPPWRSVDENAEFLGYQAMVLILKLINNRIGLLDYQRILVDCDLISV
ncbi:MAG: LacI family transcriptional regulator [Chitinophagaceae bacterium]|nr:MAG: LacI family transcriptional regulator [Chitinophagaceae bacterium]